MLVWGTRERNSLEKVEKCSDLFGTTERLHSIKNRHQTSLVSYQNTIIYAAKDERTTMRCGNGLALQWWWSCSFNSNQRGTSLLDCSSPHLTLAGLSNTRDICMTRYVIYDGTDSRELFGPARWRKHSSERLLRISNPAWLGRGKSFFSPPSRLYLDQCWAR